MPAVFDAYVDSRMAEAMLRGLAARSVAMQPAMKPIQKLIQEGFERNFSNQGGTFGARWGPLAPGTLALKARYGGGGPMEGRTGDLKAALAGGTGSVSRVSPGSVRAGVSTFYARFHQYGTKRMPARRIIGIDYATQGKATQIIEQYLVNGPAVGGPSVMPGTTP